MKLTSVVIAFAASIASAGFLAGCCSTNHVANPKDITLEKALVSVVQSLNAMREASANNQPFGLFPSDVEVTFNISASRDNTGDLKLDLAAPTGAPVTASAGGSLGFHSTATRGNQIVVKFSNLLLADQTTLVAQKGTNIIDLIKYLKGEGLLQLKH